MELGLEGRHALITGASAGIGAAIAAALSEEGCRLTLVARDSEKLAAIAARLRFDHGAKVAIHPADLRQAADVAAVAALVAASDILVNNAGDIPRGDLGQVDEAAWRHAWELKVFGYVNLSRVAFEAMRARRAGVILNVIGAAAERPDSGYIAGCAGNAALAAFTRSLGGRSLFDGVRVVGVNPGWVATERMVRQLQGEARKQFGDEARYEELLRDMPLGRAARPQEVADLVAFLVSERSAYTTGAVFTLDGGMCSRSG